MATTKKVQTALADRQCLSIPEFCSLHGFSVAYFYILKQRGQAPATMRLGRRVVISREAAAAWRAKHTQGDAA